MCKVYCTPSVYQYEKVYAKNRDEPLQHSVPLTNLVGLLVLQSEIAYGDIGIGTHVNVLAGGLALVGFILGFTNWALDVPP